MAGPRVRFGALAASLLASAILAGCAGNANMRTRSEGDILRSYGPVYEKISANPALEFGAQPTSALPRAAKWLIDESAAGIQDAGRVSKRGLRSVIYAPRELAKLATIEVADSNAQKPAPKAVNPRPRTNKGVGFSQSGIASWYGGKWHGRLTANGETYDQNTMTAAHKTLPFNSVVRVRDTKTGRSVTVRINNRGPFIRGRIIDLSIAAAKRLGSYKKGLANVEIERIR